MATYTAGDQINRALRLLGVLADGETPSASMSSNALMALNQMIDSWSTESLAVYANVDQTFTWPSGQAIRTLGPTGDFAGFRPAMLDDSTYFLDSNGISYTLTYISNSDYSSIPLKTIQSRIPVVMNVNMTNPDMTMTLYPVPSVPLEFHLMSGLILNQPAKLSTVLAFPPGYLRAFTYNLAVEIAPEYGIDPPKTVHDIAKDSKHNIQRINQPIDTLQMPSGLGCYNGSFNIYAGY